ncbi:MAG: RNA polymerase sigma factor [Candidatus Dormibacteria bacterium]
MPIAPIPGGDLPAEIAGFKPRLLGFARSLTHDEDEAEDLVQETCLRALGARDRFVPGTNLKAWLFTILRNLHLNRRRDAGVGPRVVAIDELSADRQLFANPAGDVERQVIARADIERVVAAFRGLSATFAAPLHLVAVEEMSYAETARLLDIPIGTVMSRIYRARRLLTAALAEQQ